MYTLQDRFRGCLVGLAVGDAVGTALEFQPRGSFLPITDMVGGGPFYLAPGQWTDDTSMALCLATSLCEKNGFDPLDQMDRYLAWYQKGYMSSTGECFDIGRTTCNALESFRHHRNPYAGTTALSASGNGSIMRLAPIPMFFFNDIDRVDEFAGLISKTTHASIECIDGCRLLARMLWACLSGIRIRRVLLGGIKMEFTPRIADLSAPISYLNKTRADISGSGYVVQSLEAALWVFANTTSYKEAVLMAANLGDDADTTAAVVGQLAGAYYGMEGIPQEWLDKLHDRDMIVSLADSLYSLRESK